MFTASDQHFGVFTSPFYGPQRNHFGIHLLLRTENIIFPYYRQPIQRRRAPNEKLKESKLTSIPSVTIKNQHLACADAFYGTTLIPELEVGLLLARRLICF
jgi:hypothetical protein